MKAARAATQELGEGGKQESAGGGFIDVGGIKGD